MATSSILGGERAATQADGRDTRALGPSDSSDSGSDVQGELHLETPPMGEDQFADTAGSANSPIDADSDASGTGERGAAVPGESSREGNDISPDQVSTLGGGDLLDDPDAVALDDISEEVEALANADDADDADAVADAKADAEADEAFDATAERR